MLIESRSLLIVIIVKIHRQATVQRDSCCRNEEECGEKSGGEMSPSMAGRVIKATLGLNRDSHEAQKRDGKMHPHPQVEDVVNTIGFALVQELVQYLKGQDGEQALESILDRQSRVVSRLATTPEARHATRVTASEAVEGSYAAVQRQWAAACRGKSRMMLVVAVAVGFYVLLLAVGVLLTCWRFVFFGLH